METENQYSLSFVFFCYLFAAISSVLLGCILRLARRTSISRIAEEGKKATATGGGWRRGVLIMGGLALLVGASNFGLNFSVTLLATRMDAAIVYPVIQGGGPVIVTLASRFLFRERLTLPKLLGVLLGCIGIVLLNL